MSNHTLAALRADFEQTAGRSLALPIAGVIVWAVVGISALFLPERPATYVLLLGSGMIFPIGLAVAKPLKENPIADTNPLSRLMGLSVLMVNLLWALHLTLLFNDARYFPLSLGIGLGLHWVVFSWIIEHPVGVIHAVLRTVLAIGVWWLFPAHPISAVALAVVVAYGWSICILFYRTL